MRTKLIFPFTVYIVWRLIQTIFLSFIEPLFYSTPLTQSFSQRLYLSWVSRWDSVFYLQIAWKGYEFPNQAFFPLLSLLMKLVTYMHIPLDVAGFFLVNIFSLASVVLLYALAKKITTQAVAKKSIIVFMAFPSAFFLNSLYSEGLFLTFSLLSYYLYEKKSYLLSALCAGFSSATRIIGCIIALQYSFLKKSLQTKTIYFLVALTGFIIYAAFLAYTSKTPLIFFQAQQQWTINNAYPRLNIPFKQLITYPHEFIYNAQIRNTPILAVDWIVSISFLFLGITVYKNLGPRYALYTFGVLLIPLATGNIMSMTRFVLSAFPVFIVFPLIVKKNVIFYGICMLFLVVQLIFIGCFTNNIWVG